MNNTKVIDAKVLGFSTVAAILGATFAIALSAGAAAPAEVTDGWYRGGCHDEQYAEVQKAIEGGDYEAWKALVSSTTNPRHTRLLSVITKDNFDTFTAMHAAIKAGDYAKVEELRTTLGLPVRSGRGTQGDDARTWRGHGMHR
jgi:hypothetical protein